MLQKLNKSDAPLNHNPNPNPNEVTDILTINREGPTNGTIKLLIKPNANAKIGDEVEIKASLNAPGQEFECVFMVKVDKLINEPKKKESQNKYTFPNLPTPKKAFKKSLDREILCWSDENLNWSGEDIVKVIPANNSDNELFVDGIIINMDSFALLNFISKNRMKSEAEVNYIKDKYFVSIYLHSLFLFSIMQKMKKEDNLLDPIEVDDFISKMIKPYAGFLLYENYHMEKLAFAA